MWLGGGVVLGIILGIVLMKYNKVGASMAAGWGGAVVGMVLNETALYRFGYPWLFYVSTCGCAAVAGWLATRFYEQIIILSTSILGAYAIARGASFYLGHYYNEFTIAKLVQAGLASEID